MGRKLQVSAEVTDMLNEFEKWIVRDVRADVENSPESVKEGIRHGYAHSRAIVEQYIQNLKNRMRQAGDRYRKSMTLKRKTVRAKTAAERKATAKRVRES